MTAAINRADLIRVLKQLGPEGLEVSASSLGYYKRGRKRPEPAPLPPPKKIKPATPPRRDIRYTFEDGEPRVSFWRAGQFIQLTRDNGDGAPGWIETERSVSAEDEEPDETLPVPVQRPLLPWSRLWPFLFAVLGRYCDSRRVDLDRVLDSFCRVKPIGRLTYVPRLTWAGQAQLLVDVSEPLMPFWGDNYAILKRIARMRGVSGLEVAAFDQNPDEGCREWTPKRGMGERKPYGLPAPGSSVLAVSDLGCLDTDPRRKRSWLRLGKRLKTAGFEPAALMPCPERLWDPDLAAYWTMVCWDRGATVPVKPGTGAKPSRRLPGSAADREKGVAAMLAMMAAAVRVEPALLRALRLLLPQNEADVGTEAAVWRHRALNRSPLACGFKKDEARPRRGDFYALPPELRESVMHIIRRHHMRLPGSIRAEEESVLPGACDKATGGSLYLRRVLKSGVSGTFSPGLGAWVDRFFQRLHKNQFSYCPVLSSLWMARNREAWKRGQMQAPEGFDYREAAWVLGKSKPMRLELFQQGMGLTSSPEQGVSPVVSLEVKNGWITFRTEGEDAPRGFDPGGGRIVRFPMPLEGRINLEAEGVRFQLETCRKPEWAKAIVRDRQGLCVDFGEGEEEKRAYWLPPGMYPVRVSESEVLTHRISKGFWINEREYLGILRDGLVKPDWADRIGVDEYGVYADFSIKKVTQRMRLILPGEFKMGSPENERERSDNETLHRVTLTEGYWLADTACTQGLWKSIMGKNPARFEGMMRPVESVSWVMCQEFFTEVKKLKLHMELSLPTEAQWEYACRAGTETPFSFGENITPEQVNYDGESPYTGGKKGKYRKETVDVKALPCNYWGLYQMHGNVQEWCRDWYGNYAKRPAINPNGLSNGVSRVCRGGGWFGYGGFVRSADRSGNEPSFRNVNLGFRFSHFF